MTESKSRSAELRRLLTDRRQEMEADVRRRRREGRSDRSIEVGDTLDDCDASIRVDLDLALLQMRTETLSRIDEALVRLDEGRYGSCFECERPISERRLRALPFAVRCQACEQSREHDQGRARQLAEERSSLGRFSTAVGS